MQPSNRKWRLKDVNHIEWMSYSTHIQYGNLMQSWEYGESKRSAGWMPERYLLVDGTGNSRGLLQVLVKSYCRIIQVARINRGPILFASEYTEGIDPLDVTQIWRGINRHARNSGWWIISAAPEVNTEVHDIAHSLAKAGLRRRTIKTPWASIRLSLSQDVDQLMAKQNAKWRNLLRKGLKLGVAVTEVNAINKIDEILSKYERFQIEKGFNGVPRRVLDQLVGLGGGSQTAKVYQTLCDVTSETSGFVVISYHFDTAMYLIGWSSPEGRKQKANYLLLWKAINDAKMCGLQWFDMGGVTINTPKGIAHFKTGIGGEHYSNSGEFWSIPMLAEI